MRAPHSNLSARDATRGVKRYVRLRVVFFAAFFLAVRFMVFFRVVAAM
jgi:hypothetical protein